MAEILVGAFALLVLTLGGLLNGLNGAWERVFGGETLVQGVALCASVAILLSAVDLPLSIYRIFALEARFGFNRITPRLFIADLLKQALLAALFGLPLLLLVLWLMAIMGELLVAVCLAGMGGVQSSHSLFVSHLHSAAL